MDTDARCIFCHNHEESHIHLFFACSWTSLLLKKVKSWLWINKGMSTLSSAIRGINHRGELLLPKWKGSPSALLSTSSGKKWIEGFFRTLVHWLPIYSGNFRCYFTWSCSFLIATTLSNACGMTALVAVFEE